MLTSDPLHPSARDAVDTLLLRGDTVFITAQNLLEFHALATRPRAANGMGLTPAEANTLARDLEVLFPLLEETPAIYLHWRTLMEHHVVHGRQVYDARLVAVMQAHGVEHLLTLNPTHFRRFDEITVVEPRQLVLQRRCLFRGLRMLVRAPLFDCGTSLLGQA